MLTGRQIRAARDLLGWTQAELARNTFLALSVVEVVEEYGSTFMLLDSQMQAICRAFELADVEFSSKDGGAEVRLRKGEQKDTEA